MLRLRTGYSFRQAAGHLEEVVSRLQELGSTYAPITDRVSTFAWTRWRKLTKAANLKPVFGLEVAVTNGPVVGDLKSFGRFGPPIDYWVFIANDDVGHLNKLVELATSQFYHVPRITQEQAFEVAAQGVSVVMGSKPQGIDWSHPIPNVYLGLGPATARGLALQAIRNDWPMVAVGENRYTRPEDKAFYQVLVGRDADNATYPQHILSRDEWQTWGKSHLRLDDECFDAAWNRSEAILDKSTADLKRAKLPVPHRPDTLRQMCEDGALEINCDLTRPEYAERLDRELALIEQKGYEDYFYIVADLVQWARKKMMVGPARGSSCGSLVCYLLRITTVDPIPYGLIFERFVDINRKDMPDIDIDFSDQQRWMVFDYLANKYSPERTARLGAVSILRAKSSLAVISTSLLIPQWKTDAVAESIIERSSGDARALLTIADTLANKPAGQLLLAEHPEAEIVTRLEGHPKNYTQHAAGVVLASEPISNFVAMDHRTGAVMCDKQDAEAGFNLLKIDALGLTQLSVFEDCLDFAGLPHTHLETIGLEDPKAFQVLNDGKYCGIFQFNGMALQGIVKQFKVTSFDDIVSTTALARPGPMGNGVALEWVRRRNGSKPVTYPHPIFESFMNDTLGVVLYQEQVMQIGREVGALSWEQVSELRKAMSKSLGKEYFDKFGDPWKKAAISKGVDPALAERLWDDLCSYGAMSFNKSHSVAYGIISYWCAWLKAYYPVEFAAATLSHEGKIERQIELLREMNAEGIDYLPFSPEHSREKWAVGTKGDKRLLVGPLSSIKGLGPKLIEMTLSARDRGEETPPRVRKLMENAKTPIDSLWPIRDAVHKLLPNPLDRGIQGEIRMISSIIPEFDDQFVYVMCVLAKINVRDENEDINVAKRGGQRYTDGLVTSIILRLRDDTGTIPAKINRYKYGKLGPEIEKRGRVGKAVYCVKGKQRGHGGTEDGFRFIMVEGVRYIGDLDDADRLPILEAAE